MKAMASKLKKKKKAARVAAKPNRNGERPRASTGTASESACPIVGIGGSAGGFEAAMELLQHLPTNAGTAFAVVQHLDPHHASRLASLLGRATKMPVIEVKQMVTPQPNTVY